MFLFLLFAYNFCDEYNQKIEGKNISKFLVNDN